MKKYDIIVIGSGAGTKISTPASKLGLKVALIEKSKLGGTCLNRGCIPSKMLIHSAEVAQTIDTAHKYQIISKGYELNFKALVDRVSQTIDEESLSIQPGIEANPNLDWYQDHARFIDHKVLQVGEEQITAEKIFIVAGARPFIPDISGLAGTPYITSTEALRLNQFPQSMIVVGGGYIATELAFYFAALGVRMTMLVRNKMLTGEDFEIREEFQKVFSSQFDVQFQAFLTQIEYKNQKFHVTYLQGEEERTLEAEQLFVATGVTPNSDGLDLEKTGIVPNADGFIPVNEYLETEVEGIWAFGDIVGNYLFRHSANYEGEYLQEIVVHGEPKYPIDYTGMPHAVFSNPQVAGVGEREDDLIARGAQYVVGKHPFSASAMGMALLSEHGFLKLLIEKKTHKILGCHIIGHEASILIHQVIPLLRKQGTLEDLLYMVHIHPALSELVRNVARKARNALLEAGEDLPVKLRIK